MARKAVEKKLFQAFKKGSGVWLTPRDVENLLLQDDALRTRITNVAAVQFNAPEPGVDLIDRADCWVDLMFLAGGGGVSYDKG